MKKLVLAAAVVAVPAFAQGFELKGDAAKGEGTYKSMCASCHGEKGDGAGAAAAALNPKPTNFTDPANADRLTPEYVYNVTKNGGASVGKSPLMVAWSGSLKDDQLRDVAAYVLKFKPAKPEAKDEAKPTKGGKKK
jgi:cytochrome c553